MPQESEIKIKENTIENEMKINENTNDTIESEMKIKENCNDTLESSCSRREPEITVVTDIDAPEMNANKGNDVNSDKNSTDDAPEINTSQTSDMNYNVNSVKKSTEDVPQMNTNKISVVIPNAERGGFFMSLNSFMGDSESEIERKLGSSSSSHAVRAESKGSIAVSSEHIHSQKELVKSPEKDLNTELSSGGDCEGTSGSAKQGYQPSYNRTRKQSCATSLVDSVTALKAKHLDTSKPFDFPNWRDVCAVAAPKFSPEQDLWSSELARCETEVKALYDDPATRNNQSLESEKARQLSRVAARQTVVGAFWTYVVVNCLALDRHLSSEIVELLLLQGRKLDEQLASFYSDDTKGNSITKKRQLTAIGLMRPLLATAYAEAVRAIELIPDDRRYVVCRSENDDNDSPNCSQSNDRGNDRACHRRSSAPDSEDDNPPTSQPQIDSNGDAGEWRRDGENSLNAYSTWQASVGNAPPLDGQEDPDTIRQRSRKRKKRQQKEDTVVPAKMSKYGDDFVEVVCPIWWDDELHHIGGEIQRAEIDYAAAAGNYQRMQDISQFLVDRRRQSIQLEARKMVVTAFFQDFSSTEIVEKNLLTRPNMSTLWRQAQVLDRQLATVFSDPSREYCTTASDLVNYELTMPIVRQIIADTITMLKPKQLPISQLRETIGELMHTYLGQPAIPPYLAQPTIPPYLAQPTILRIPPQLGEPAPKPILPPKCEDKYLTSMRRSTLCASDKRVEIKKYSTSSSTTDLQDLLSFAPQSTSTQHVLPPFPGIASPSVPVQSLFPSGASSFLGARNSTAMPSAAVLHPSRIIPSIPEPPTISTSPAMDLTAWLRSVSKTSVNDDEGSAYEDIYKIPSRSKIRSFARSSSPSAQDLASSSSDRSSSPHMSSAEKYSPTVGPESTLKSLMAAYKASKSDRRQSPPPPPSKRQQRSSSPFADLCRILGVQDEAAIDGFGSNIEKSERTTPSRPLVTSSWLYSVPDEESNLGDLATAVAAIGSTTAADDDATSSANKTNIVAGTLKSDADWDREFDVFQSGCYRKTFSAISFQIKELLLEMGTCEDMLRRTADLATEYNRQRRASRRRQISECQRKIDHLRMLLRTQHGVNELGFLDSLWDELATAMKNGAYQRCVMPKKPIRELPIWLTDEEDGSIHVKCRKLIVSLFMTVVADALAQRGIYTSESEQVLVSECMDFDIELKSHLRSRHSSLSAVKETHCDNVIHSLSKSHCRNVVTRLSRSTSSLKM